MIPFQNSADRRFRSLLKNNRGSPPEAPGRWNGRSPHYLKHVISPQKTPGSRFGDTQPLKNELPNSFKNEPHALIDEAQASRFFDSERRAVLR
jgi:hypothetical protein